MDLTYARGTTPAPVVVMVHGGAFRVGDKSELAVWPELLDAGIAVVRVNYRLSDSAKWPAQGDDCLSAVVHLLREEIADILHTSTR